MTYTSYSMYTTKELLSFEAHTQYEMELKARLESLMKDMSAAEEDLIRYEKKLAKINRTASKALTE